jgi:ribosomal protein S12 methylthiotransferase accessory factor
MFETISRPYKERTAQDTITTIREILEPLGLLPQETFHANPYPEVYSLSLELPEDSGGFRSNGKGRNTEFCRASAYAEYMERMQNGLYATLPRTFLATFQREHGFYYSPDEHYMQPDEFEALLPEIVGDIVRYSGDGRADFIASYFARIKENGLPGMVAMPFYDTLNRNVVSLPLNLLLLTVGSNGMAAGNTIGEAIFMGLCELLERWGAAEVFYNKLTPPTVSRDYLSRYPEECAIIAAIEQGGKYRVTVKDFSAGKGIPSVGVIVENQIAHTYRLDVGSDTCFQVALSRCLTEVYQGVENAAAFDAAALPIPQAEAPHFLKDDAASLYQRWQAFTQFTKDGRGAFPFSLFGPRPSYTFDPEVFSQRSSYEEEVRRLIAYFHRLGHNVYVRDVSFLGFPSVFIYVPVVSAEGRKNVPAPASQGNYTMLEIDKIEAKVFNLKRLSKEELLEVAKVLESLGPAHSVMNLFNVNMKQDSPWRQLPVAFLLTQIWYKLGQLDKARQSLGLFLQGRSSMYEYYRLVDRYLELKANGLPARTIQSQLLKESSMPDLVMVACQDLANPDHVLDFVRLPNCPDCSTCELHTDCATRGKVSMAQALYPEMRRNELDQSGLEWVS